MLKNKTFKVTWNYISQTTFMYGSKVSFSNGEVTFYKSFDALWITDS